jgi:hypothetical protein
LPVELAHEPGAALTLWSALDPVPHFLLERVAGPGDRWFVIGAAENDPAADDQRRE